jgi:hypothetical protein
MHMPRKLDRNNASSVLLYSGGEDRRMFARPLQWTEKCSRPSPHEREARKKTTAKTNSAAAGQLFCTHH